MTLDSILVMADPSMQVTPALRRGIELARRARARLQLCLFDFNPLIEATAELVHPDVMRLAKTQFLEERRRWLTAQAAALGGEGQPLECEVIWAPVLHEAVLARVMETGPALVVKDLQHEAGIKRYLVTPADGRLMRYCPVPLMLVGPHSAQLPQRILAAVDTGTEPPASGSLNDLIVAKALELGLYSGAEVHLAHAFPYEPLQSAPYRKLEHVYAELRQLDADSFSAFARRHNVPEERRHWLEGEPATAIVDIAGRTGADLVVIASVHRSVLDRLFIGSTAESLIDRIGSDLLLLKPENFLIELSRHLDIDGLCRRYGVEPASPRPGVGYRRAAGD